jgi:predicted nucleic acid-binding protein
VRGAVLADTGPLYAAFDPRDDDHERALEDLRRLKAENLKVVVPYPVLLEAHNLAARKLGHLTAVLTSVDPGANSQRGRTTLPHLLS